MGLVFLAPNLHLKSASTGSKAEKCAFGVQSPQQEHWILPGYTDLSTCMNRCLLSLLSTGHEPHCCNWPSLS